MDYFEIFKIENDEYNYLMLLKYPIDIFDDTELLNNIKKFLRENNVILDMFVKNGFNNRYFTLTAKNNHFSINEFSNLYILKSVSQSVNSYLRDNIDILLNSSLSSKEINKILILKNN